MNKAVEVKTVAGQITWQQRATAAIGEDDSSTLVAVFFEKYCSAFWTELRGLLFDKDAKKQNQRCKERDGVTLLLLD